MSPATNVECAFKNGSSLRLSSIKVLAIFPVNRLCANSRLANCPDNDMRREKDVIVHEERSVIDFDEQVLLVVLVKTGSSSRGYLGPSNRAIRRDNFGRRVMTDLNVDRGVKFDAGDLCAGEQSPGVNLVHGVAGNGAESCAQTPHDTRLLAMGNRVPANHVASDIFF